MTVFNSQQALLSTRGQQDDITAPLGEQNLGPPRAQKAPVSPHSPAVLSSPGLAAPSALGSAARLPVATAAAAAAAALAALAGLAGLEGAGGLDVSPSGGFFGNCS